MLANICKPCKRVSVHGQNLNANRKENLPLTLVSDMQRSLLQSAAAESIGGPNVKGLGSRVFFYRIQGLGFQDL